MIVSLKHSAGMSMWSDSGKGIRFFNRLTTHLDANANISGDKQDFGRVSITRILPLYNSVTCVAQGTRRTVYMNE